jgi:membrane-bound serine protease (ClpP class)
MAIKHRLLLSLLLLLLFCVLHPIASWGTTKQKAVLLEINTSINPATQDYIQRGIRYAVGQKSPFVILQMDTPGGLDKSMREIIKDILSSRIPIIAYVAPEGARAASAGTYILYACHIAAMAHATNLGAATPISIGGGFPFPGTPPKEPGKGEEAKTPMEKKVIGDAVAYIEGLAKLRGHNEEWAEKAVREGVSIDSQEALKLHVIDFIAKDIPDLLKQLNGRVVTIQGRNILLDTAHVEVEKRELDWRARFLSIITDPTVAYLLLIIGFYGIFFELANPGYVLPGIVGFIAIILALYAFQLLPISYAGLALVIVGIGFILSELYFTSYGILGIGGIVAFVVGSVLLLDIEGHAIPWGIILGMSTVTVIFFLILLRLVLKVRRQNVVSGLEALVGQIAIVQLDFKGEGRVKVGGELWKANSAVSVKRGQRVKIVSVKGLELYVEALKDEGEKE